MKCDDAKCPERKAVKTSEKVPALINAILLAALCVVVSGCESVICLAITQSPDTGVSLPTKRETTPSSSISGKAAPTANYKYPAANASDADLTTHEKKL